MASGVYSGCFYLCCLPARQGRRLQGGNAASHSPTHGMASQCQNATLGKRNPLSFSLHRLLLLHHLLCFNVPLLGCRAGMGPPDPPFWAADPPGADPCPPVLAGQLGRADHHCQPPPHCSHCISNCFLIKPPNPPILASVFCSVAGGIDFSMGTSRWWCVEQSGMLRDTEASRPFCSIFMVVPRIPALHTAPLFFGGRKVALRTQWDGWREPQPQGFTDHSLVYLGQGDNEELGSPALGMVTQSWHHPNIPEALLTPRLDSALPCAGFTLPGILRDLAPGCGWGEGDPKAP